jgi:hypothetical protein
MSRAAGPDYRYPHLFVKVYTLHLDFRFRRRSSYLGLSYLDLLPRQNLAGSSGQFSTLSGILRLSLHL